MKYSLLRITDKCNQKCLFCNVPPESSNEYPSSFDDIESAIGRTGPSGALILSGGEPTISKRLPDVVSLARSRGIRRIELQTNATMMSSLRFARSIATLGFDNLLVSLHSHEAATSDLLTRAPGSFDQTLRGIANLNDLAVPLTLNFVITSLNFRQLPDFVSFFMERKDVFRPTNTICLSFVQPNGCAWESRATIVPRITAVIPYLERALDSCLANGLRFAISESGIPVCFVEKFKDHHQEYQKSLSGIRDALTVVNASEKIKRPDCVACAYSARCLGLWKNYAKLYGVGELRPIGIARDATRHGGRP
jgi:uncharacterized radical SAM superfamily Fe-S cluster-containing enzyme